MRTEVKYREQLKIEMRSETDEQGERVIRAVVRGEKRLFDAVVLLEEKAGVLSMEERIRGAIEREVIESLKEIDAFFKLVRSSRPRKSRGGKSAEAQEPVA